MRTWRDGVLLELPTRELVVGDVIELERGAAVPADARVLRTSACTYDMSALTGHADVRTASIAPTSDHPLESCNLLFFGATVQDGSATALVVATGSTTLLGRLAGQLFHLRRNVRPPPPRRHGAVAVTRARGQRSTIPSQEGALARSQHRVPLTTVKKCAHSVCVRAWRGVRHVAWRGVRACPTGHARGSRAAARDRVRGVARSRDRHRILRGGARRRGTRTHRRRVHGRHRPGRGSRGALDHRAGVPLPRAVSPQAGRVGWGRPTPTPLGMR